MGGGSHFYDKAPGLIDVEKARIAGQPLSEFDERRLRNHQLRRARRMYLNTMSLSDREPLWRVGPHGVRYEEAGRLPGSVGDGAKGAQGWYRIIRFFKDFGSPTAQKLGWNPNGSPHEQFLAGEWGQIALNRGRWFASAMAFFTFATGFVGAFWYMQGWSGYVNRQNLIPGIRYCAPPTYPGDETITGQLCDLQLVRGQNAMDWKHEAKPLPKGTRFDWLTGKPITPEELPTNAYYNRHGMPLENITKIGTQK